MDSEVPYCQDQVDGQDQEGKDVSATILEVKQPKQRSSLDSVFSAISSQTTIFEFELTPARSNSQLARHSRPTQLPDSDDLPGPALPKSVHYPSPYSWHDSVSFTTSSSTIMNEKLPSIDQGALPAKKYDRLTRNLRWTVFSVYRRLNLIVLIPNVIAMIVLGASGDLLHLTPQATATAVATNLCAAVLMRQELVINLLFIIFGKCPQSFPLRIRRLAAKIYHLGGVHSGTAIAATIWFGFYNVSIGNLEEQQVGREIKIVLLVFTAILDALLLAICISAYPTLRAKYHDWFECIHRFAGWTSIVLFWIHVVLLTFAKRKTIHDDPMPPVWQLLAGSPPFWLLVTITVMLTIPWWRLRKVDVFPERLSDHAIRLHFTYNNTPLCAAPRFSDNPLKEWHAFAAIPEPGGNGFSVFVSSAGDWTRKIINNPPRRLWTKGILTRGVLNVAPIFKKQILICTGSGIGPILALTLNSNINCRILWSTPSPEATFGKSIMDSVAGVDPNAVIINTTVTGRQDLLEPAYRLYKEFEAEAVFIISNQRVTRRLVYGLESRGVPVFAPVFDS